MSKLAIAAAMWVIARPKIALADDNWINPSNGDWSDGANWSTGSPPQPGDNVTNSFGTATISYSAIASVSNIDDSGGLTINGGSLAVNGITANSITVNGGTLAGMQAGSATPVGATGITINGGVISSLTLDSGSPVAVTGNSTLSNVIVFLLYSSGQLSFSGQSSTTIAGTTTFAAITSLSGGSLNLAPGALLVNPLLAQFRPYTRLWKRALKGMGISRDLPIPPSLMPLRQRSILTTL